MYGTYGIKELKKNYILHLFSIFPKTLIFFFPLLNKLEDRSIWNVVVNLYSGGGGQFLKSIRIFKTRAQRKERYQIQYSCPGHIQFKKSSLQAGVS